MNVKKKFISFSRRLCILSLCVVIGLSASLQGFCAGETKVIVDYDYITLAAQLFNSNGSMLNNGNEISLKARDTYTYYYQIPASTGIVGSYILKIYIKDFFNNLSSDSSYNYRLMFGFDGGSSIYSLFGSSATLILAGHRYTASKSSEPNGNTRYIFDFNFTGVSGTSNLVLEFPITIKSAVSFSFFCCSYPTNSYYIITTGPDKVLGQFGSNYSKPNTSDVDNYNNAESQLYNGVASSLDDINSQWKNINGDLLQYQGAFLAVGNFFNNLTGLDWIKVVLILSVSIGMFALLLGAVNSVFKGRGD